MNGLVVIEGMEEEVVEVERERRKREFGGRKWD